MFFLLRAMVNYQAVTKTFGIIVFDFFFCHTPFIKHGFTKDGCNIALYPNFQKHHNLDYMQVPTDSLNHCIY